MTRTRWPAITSVIDRSGTTVAHDVDHRLIVLEYPVPVGAPGDAHRGLVGAETIRERRSRARMRRDLGVEARLAPAANIASSAALADLQRVELLEAAAVTTAVR